MRFDDLKLASAVLRAVHAEGYEVPTPIQQKAIPHVLAGEDLLGCAQTGTGKTAAFALPILSRLGNAAAPRHGSATPIRVLVLTPTRELAAQIAESFTTYGRHTGLEVGLIFGGVSQSGQERMLRHGVDILIATPGRLLDLMNQRLVHLGSVEVFVLDEADRMLDMGFIADIRKVITQLPARRQNLMFSATMAPEIKRLADGILQRPVHVAVAPVSSTAERVEQSLYLVDRQAKPALLLHLLKSDRSITRVLIFTRTKHGANRLTKGLDKHGIRAEAIHGNKSQNQRQRALDTFKQGQTRVLVATDIAARGLDIEQVSHVINFDLPNIPESYVHRIGRTARAGESGIAISFCDPEEREFLRDIERVIGRKIPVVPAPAGVGAAAERSFEPERDSDLRALRGHGGGGGGRGAGHRGDHRREARPASSPRGQGPAPGSRTGGSSDRETTRPASTHRAPSPSPSRAPQRPGGPFRDDAGAGRPPAPSPSHHDSRNAPRHRDDRTDRSRPGGGSSQPTARPDAGRWAQDRSPRSPDRGPDRSSRTGEAPGRWRGESASAGTSWSGRAVNPTPERRGDARDTRHGDARPARPAHPESRPPQRGEDRSRRPGWERR